MSTYREVVHMVLDELKLTSDDAYFTERHVVFLLDKYRVAALKEAYNKAANSLTAMSLSANKLIPESDYQTICLDLEVVDSIRGLCDKGKMLRSRDEIPPMTYIGMRHVYAENFFASDITIVEKERLRYVGNDKWRRSFIYACVGPDKRLWFKSGNPQHLYLKRAKLTAIFENASKAAELACDSDTVCDVLDAEFPLEDGLVNTVIQAVVAELTRPNAIPEDISNNANDDIPLSLNAASAARKKSRNTKTTDDDYDD